MTYWNPVERYGVERFAARPRRRRGSGPDHARPHPGRRHRLDRRRRRPRPRQGLPRRAVLDRRADRDDGRRPAAASSTPPRSWASPAPATTTSDLAGPLVARTKAATELHSDLPVGVGLGVSNGDQAAEVASYADGVIVGSAFVRALLDHADDRAAGLDALSRSDRGPRRRASRRGRGRTAPRRSPRRRCSPAALAADRLRRRRRDVGRAAPARSSTRRSTSCRRRR